MKSKLHELRRRVAALEERDGGDVIFELRDGSSGRIRHRRLLRSLGDAVDHRDTPGARIMLQAVRASTGSCLHELAQALAAGPVSAGQVNSGLDDE